MSDTAAPPSSRANPAEVLDLPSGNEGLAWIVSHDPVQLLFVPEIHALSVIAAAAGDHHALDHLKATAHRHATSKSIKKPFSLFCQAAVASLSSRLSFRRAARGYDSDSDYGCCTRQSKPQNEESLTSTYEKFQEHTAKMMRQAAEENQVAALQWLRVICHRNEATEFYLISHACETDNLPLFRLLLSGPSALDIDAYTLRSSKIRCLQWCIQHTRPGVWEDYTVKELARSGDLDTFKQLQTHGRIAESCWDAALLDTAIYSGNLALVQHIRGQDATYPLTADCMSTAARQGDLPMMQWLRAQDPPCPWPAFGIASNFWSKSGNQADILQWAITSGHNIGDREVDWAAEAGELSLLATMRGLDGFGRFGWKNAAQKAASKGHISVLEWLRDSNVTCSWACVAPAAAAGSGRTDVLQWLRAQDPPCPWDHESPTAAAKNGHLDVLKWLLKEGCKMDVNNLYCKAAMEGHIGVLAFLNSQGIKPLKPLNMKNEDRWFSSRAEIAPTILLYLDAISCPLDWKFKHQLDRARDSYCTFHGLLRWCRNAAADPSSAHLAFDCLAADPTGQFMLIRLALLPPELITKIAIMAKIQHDQEL